ncbi:universal stress protein [Mucilaginibacter sp. CAU 1740]|uniref:universal stress protein n=1 Tax=Mucilaginibacter sp. CAU 1740 TaxID=3140365 RepID=UPI00325B746C
MKKIAVLTDFSERAYHAAEYALSLAARLQANVLLYHAFFQQRIEMRFIACHFRCMRCKDYPFPDLRQTFVFGIQVKFSETACPSFMR